MPSPAGTSRLTAQPSNDPSPAPLRVDFDARDGHGSSPRATAADRLLEAPPSTAAPWRAAEQLGRLRSADRDVAVEYASQRKQFGVPIGSFQAVKHHLATCKVALEYARSLV